MHEISPKSMENPEILTPNLFWVHHCQLQFVLRNYTVSNTSIKLQVTSGNSPQWTRTLDTIVVFWEYRHCSIHGIIYRCGLGKVHVAVVKAVPEKTLHCQR